MRHIPFLHFIALLARFILLTTIAVLVVLIIRQWNEGISIPMEPIDDSPCRGLQFIAYNNKRETARGKNFSCDLKSYLYRWKIADDFVYKTEPINASEVVFVTYSSDNHFYEARKAIRSIRSISKNKIIFYDIGLEYEQIAELNNVCNLEVRNFTFDRYPDFVARIIGYNFKPIIMAEVYSEFKHYWIIDTSVRFFDVKPYLDNFYANISSGTIETLALRHPSSHSIYATTHPRMYEYLPIETSLAQEWEMCDANTMFISRSELSREAIKWNALCALTEECMAPTGAGVSCWFGEDRYKTQANCHRYDQSSINIIVASLLERDGWRRRDRVKDDSMQNFTIVNRGDGEAIPMSLPCQ